MAYPIIGHRKLARLMQVARHTPLTVALDNLLPVRQLSDAAREARVSVGVLAEVDVGLGRVGVSPGTELLQLVEGILRLLHLTFEGIAFYPGHVRSLDPEGLRALDRVGELVRKCLADLRRAGFEPKMVSGGSKTFSSDRSITPPEATFGHLVEAPEAVFTRMNEEHGYVDIRRAERDFAVGDRLHVIPNHICTAMNLHETVYGLRGNQVEQVWKVEARGKLQ